MLYNSLVVALPKAPKLRCGRAQMIRERPTFLFSRLSDLSGACASDLDRDLY